jgi:hypothetical protein
MSTINSHAYTFQQVGFGQNADINASIPNHILCKGIYTLGAEKYQPRQSRKAPTRGIARTIQGIFSSLLLS